MRRKESRGRRIQSKPKRTISGRIKRAKRLQSASRDQSPITSPPEPARDGANEMKINRDEMRQESLNRAVNGQSLANYGAIFEGFAAKGIPESEIHPRENVFTFNAWKAKGRFVKKGEHGVKVLTFIETETKTGEISKRPWSSTVFHISQTEVSTA